MTQPIASPTSPVFLGDAPQAVQPVTAVAPEPDAADTVVAIPVFDPQRAKAIHAHKVLGRLLATPSLPVADTQEVHNWGSGAAVDLMFLFNVPATLDAYQKLFGGTRTSEERESFGDYPAFLYHRLETVIEGVTFVIWGSERLLEAPVEAEAAAETTEVTL